MSKFGQFTSQDVVDLEILFNKSWLHFFSCWHAGSIFVDCGSNASYVDKVTNISWVPDAQYITAGENRYVASAQSIYPNFSEFTTIRYFPDSTAKNCYSFPAITNQTYQIRGTFFYGFYDNAMTTPSFQMGIDGTIVANVTFNDAVTFVYHEFTYVSQPNSNKTFLCLLRDSSNSVPFISAISFSPMPNDFFYGPSPVQLYEGHYVQTKYRLNFGGNRFVRYANQIMFIPSSNNIATLPFLY
jgi:hypothetical protein